jgi:hypothetical protein
MNLQPLLAAAMLTAVPASLSATERFTLGAAVPGNVFLYYHSVHNPEREFLSRHWARVLDAVDESQLGLKLQTQIAQLLPEAERANFVTVWNRTAELLSTVQWRRLCDKEFVVAARMGAILPEFILLGRTDPDLAERNFQAFSTLLLQGSERIDIFTVEKRTIGPATFYDLIVEALPYKFTLAHQGDVLALSFGLHLGEEAFASMNGQNKAGAIVESARYKEIMARLPVPEDSIRYIDYQALFGGIKSLVQAMFPTLDSSKPMGERELSAGGAYGPARLAARVLMQLCDHLAIFDRSATVASTDATTTTEDSITVLAPNAKESLLYPVLARQETFEKFDRYIPLETQAFSLSAGIDPNALYGAVTSLLQANIPNAQVMFDNWRDLQDRIGIHLQEDVLSWIGGEYITITLPAAIPTPFRLTDTVWMIRVTDPALADSNVKTGAEMLVQAAADAGQPLIYADVEGLEGFKSLAHPIFQMLLKPHFGVKDGWLIVGTSAKAITTCLETAAGKHDSIAKQRRFQKEGLIPEGAVSSASFHDLSDMGRRFSSYLTAGTVLGQLMPDQPHLRPIRAITGLLGAFSPVVARLDFFRSSADFTTFDGMAWKTKSIVNYRPFQESAPTTTRSASQPAEPATRSYAAPQ